MGLIRNLQILIENNENRALICHEYWSICRMTFHRREKFEIYKCQKLFIRAKNICHTVFPYLYNKLKLRNYADNDCLLPLQRWST